ncbi:MAG TPA: CDP-alcohol phosphatidyltransferase family protein [Beijerinckiaceae bacterium]|jgi:phosphatidylcholine synthase
MTSLTTAAAWGVHVFTASGAAAGLLALERAYAGDMATCFAWLALALVIDGVDGTLARALRVKERAATIDGDALDLVIDYFTYVVVPTVVFMRSGLTPGWLATTLGLAIVAASAIYFGDKRMKTPDHWFRGFPAIWNVLVFYLLVYAPPAWLAALIVLAALVLMFCPIVFVHPLRVVRLRSVTVVMLAVWAAAAGLALASDLSGSFPAKVGLAVAGAYFLLLPLTRSGRRARG